MDNILQIKQIDKHFGNTHAVRSVSFEIERGEVCALMGENGAGKSTIGKIIGGVYPPDSGEIIFENKKVFPKTPLEAQEWGISIIHQELDMFPNASVAMNIVINNTSFPQFQHGFINPKKAGALVKPYTDMVHLNVSPSTMVEDLSMAQMQLVYIARCLSMKSKLIIMDEPTSSLTEDAVDNLFLLVKELKKNGATIIFISHKMSEIYAIADTIIILRDGEFIRKAKVEEIKPDEVISAMVGRKISGELAIESHAEDLKVLEVKNLINSKLKNISFYVNKGEVLGIAGLVGAGRTEIGETLFGIRGKESGQIFLKGKELTSFSPKTAIQNGFGLVPEDRKLMGLMMDLSVKENASLADIFRMQKNGFIDFATMAERTKEVMDETRIKADSPDIEVDSLSGGNQQKVLIGRWLMVNPDIFFLDDPTRGVDVGAKEDIYQIIEQLTRKGKSVIFVSSELPELLRCCDRIMVMNEGKASCTLNAKETTQEEIMVHAAN